MNWKRILLGKLDLNYNGWQRWLSFSLMKRWEGRLIYLNFSKLSLVIDCRKDWVEDMKTGVAQ